MGLVVDPREVNVIAENAYRNHGKGEDLAAGFEVPAERPLVIIGKGAAYSRAEDEVRKFIESTRLPFLSSPMGKGVVDDEHALSVMPARGLALQDADVVVLGTRTRGVIGDALVGHTAERVFGMLGRGLLTLPPGGAHW